MTGTAQQLRPGDTVLTKGPALILAVHTIADEVELTVYGRDPIIFSPLDDVTWFRTAAS